jgi:hypothetical protein
MYMGIHETASHERALLSGGQATIFRPASLSRHNPYSSSFDTPLL